VLLLLRWDPGQPCVSRTCRGNSQDTNGASVPAMRLHVRSSAADVCIQYAVFQCKKENSVSFITKVSFCIERECDLISASFSKTPSNEAESCDCATEICESAALHAPVLAHFGISNRHIKRHIYGTQMAFSQEHQRGHPICSERRTTMESHWH